MRSPRLRSLPLALVCWATVEQAGDVVAGVRVVGGKICVVHVELAHGDAIGQGRPLAVEGAIVGGAEETSATVMRVRVAKS